MIVMVKYDTLKLLRIVLFTVLTYFIHSKYHIKRLNTI